MKPKTHTFLGLLVLVLGVAITAFAAPVVEVEETVVKYASPDNGAGPLWCYGAPLLARVGERVFVSVSETGEGVPPLCNTRWRLYAREKSGWVVKQSEADYREREPCPLGALSRDRLVLSVNPSTQPPGTKYGPCEPQALRFSTRALDAAPEILSPRWVEGHTFTDHSYRGFAVDAKAHEFLLLNIDAKTSEQNWSFYNRKQEWAATGKIQFPIRACYPQTALRRRAAHVLAVGDIVEPTPEWRQFKKEKTGRDWDYVFRRLFYAWTPNVTRQDFCAPIEIDTVDATAGHITNLDVWIDAQGTAYLLYLKRPVQNDLMRDRYFPALPLVSSLECVAVKDGVIIKRITLVMGGEKQAGPEPHYARFQALPDGTLDVISYVTETRPDGKRVEQNRLQAVLPQVGEASPISFQEPFRMFFTATERGGSKPSKILDLFGIGNDGNVLRYGRVKIR